MNGTDHCTDDTERQPDVPEPGQTVDVFVDRYECLQCGSSVDVADFAHRTHVAYDTPTIRCQCKDVPMQRVRKQDSDAGRGDGL